MFQNYTISIIYANLSIWNLIIFAAGGPISNMKRVLQTWEFLLSDKFKIHVSNKIGILACVISTKWANFIEILK